MLVLHVPLHAVLVLRALLDAVTLVLPSVDAHAPAGDIVVSIHAGECPLRCADDPVGEFLQAQRCGGCGEAPKRVALLSRRM